VQASHLPSFVLVAQVGHLGDVELIDEVHQGVAEQSKMTARQRDRALSSDGQGDGLVT
jgi:hypothetical protein